MRYVLIDKAAPGMILAKGVYDSYNRMLVAPKHAISGEHIQKLKDRGYSGFYIEDEYSSGIDIKETISSELRNKGVETLRKNDIDGTLNVAKNIVEQILSSDTVTLDMVDLRTFDDYTYRHSINVAVLSTIIGMGMGLDKEALGELCTAAIFHDLGKLMIDPKILNKPGRLTKEEFRIIKEHPQLSVELLKDRWNVASTSKIGILFHHENEDGSGYPNGLEGDAIHIYAKIVHVADVYDALTSKRPYKEPYTPSEAIEYLMGGSHILFNDEVVSAFLKYVPVYPKGVTVMLSDGREGIVFENTVNPIRPKIKLKDGGILDLGDVTHNLDVTINPTSMVETDYSNEMAVLSDENDSRKVILAVDDMITNLQQVRNALEKDYKIIMVKSGMEAIDYIKNNKHPDLILMDIILPQLDGVETVEIIRTEISDKIPVMFLTALSDRETVKRCRDVNAVDYIVKPFRPLYIRERVHAALEGDSLCLT